MCRDLVAGKFGPPVQFDAIILDEAQDSYPPWIEALWTLVKPDGGSFLILYDRAQAIHRVAMPIERVLRLTAPSVSKWQLQRNHRYPRDVFSYYAAFADLDEVFRQENREFQDGMEPIDSKQGLAGIVPHKMWSEEAALQAAKGIIASCAERADSVGLIYVGEGMLCSRPMAARELAFQGIVVSPLGGLRGLEFDVVLLFGFNAGFPAGDIDPETLSNIRRMFLVAVTRARSELHVFYWSNEPSSLVQELIAHAQGRSK